MKKFPFRSLALLLGAILFGSVVYAQSLFTGNLVGTEVFEFANALGGTYGNTTAYVLRNGKGYLAVATGTTVNTTVPNTASIVYATGAITTWNITLPIVPFDGQVVSVNCPGGTASTIAITATAPVGVTTNGTSYTTCSSGGTAAQGASWIYSATAKSWNRFL